MDHLTSVGERIKSIRRQHQLTKLNLPKDKKYPKVRSVSSNLGKLLNCDAQLPLSATAEMYLKKHEMDVKMKMALPLLTNFASLQLSHPNSDPFMQTPIMYAPFFHCGIEYLSRQTCTVLRFSHTLPRSSAHSAMVTCWKSKKRFAVVYVY